MVQCPIFSDGEGNNGYIIASQVVMKNFFPSAIRTPSAASLVCLIVDSVETLQQFTLHLGN